MSEATDYATRYTAHYRNVIPVGLINPLLDKVNTSIVGLIYNNNLINKPRLHACILLSLIGLWSGVVGPKVLPSQQPKTFEINLFLGEQITIKQPSIKQQIIFISLIYSYSMAILSFISLLKYNKLKDKMIFELLTHLYFQNEAKDALLLLKVESFMEEFNKDCVSLFAQEAFENTPNELTATL
jgi:hypothetical protein